MGRTGGGPKPALRGPFAVCSGSSTKARRMWSGNANLARSCRIFHTCRIQFVQTLQVLFILAPEGVFLREPWCPAWLTEVLAKGCKLTRDASKDSWFSGRRRVSAMELRLRKLSRRKSRHVPRQAAHPDSACAHRWRPLVVLAGRISGPARPDRSYA